MVRWMTNWQRLGKCDCEDSLAVCPPIVDIEIHCLEDIARALKEYPCLILNTMEDFSNPNPNSVKPEGK